MFTWDYWYVFPFAVLVATIANASGFSGAVLFQPFFNFVLKLPIGQSIATGVATETIGMSSGAFRYHRMKKIDCAAVKALLPAVWVGVLAGLFVFSYAPRDYLRLIVGLVVGGIAAYQFLVVWRGRLASGVYADVAVLARHRGRAFCMGGFSACTGTGVAEMSQPLLEQRGGLATKRANATAIALESLADWAVTLANLSLGNLRFDILVFSASGVLIGAQLGAWLSPHVPDRLLKSIFAVCVFGIGAMYVVTSVRALCWPVSAK
jgi:uncharacterized membrane protein YfcA